MLTVSYAPINITAHAVPYMRCTQHQLPCSHVKTHDSGCSCQATTAARLSRQAWRQPQISEGHQEKSQEEQEMCTQNEAVLPEEWGRSKGCQGTA